MNRFFTLLFAASCLTAVGQVTYPYNPDGNADSLIGASDIQDLLSGYGLPFSPSEILVDGQTLTTVLTQLQNSIDSLSGLGGSGGSVLDMPLGTVLPIATESVPEGWMLCDGREISIEEYQGLYDLIGTTYGAGDSAFWAQVFYPATTFNIPDLRGRTIIGSDDMGGMESGLLTNHDGSLGEVGGAERHQLSLEEIPAHSHEYSGGYIGSDGTGNNGVVQSGGQSVETSSVGGDQPHNNMQPYMALNYMIKVQLVDDVVAAMQNTIETQQSQIDSLSELMGILYDFVYYSGCGLQTSVNYLGHEYPLVDLGDQCWFGENLSVQVFRNGDAIPFLGTNGDALLANDGTGIDGYTYPNGDVALADQGYLYNGYVTIDERAICPTGYRLPNQDDFNSLREKFLADPDSFLDSVNWHGSNENGFSAVPTGRFENDFKGFGTHMWLYGRQTGTTDVTVLTLSDWNGSIEGGHSASVWDPWPEEGYHHGRIYFSLRCIKGTE